MAPSYGALLAARVMQGVGAALVLSCGPALATSLHSETARTRVLGIYTMVIGVGGALGPLIAGLLVPLIDWPAVFWFRAPLALSAFLLAWLLPRRHAPRASRDSSTPPAALCWWWRSARCCWHSTSCNVSGSYPLWFAVATFTCVLATGGFILQERANAATDHRSALLSRYRLLAAECRTCGAKSGGVLGAAARAVLSEPLRRTDGLRDRPAARLLACRHCHCGTARGAARGAVLAAAACADRRRPRWRSGR